MSGINGFVRKLLYEYTEYYSEENGQQHDSCYHWRYSCHVAERFRSTVKTIYFLAKENEEIRELIAGLVRRQFMCITIDEYANAFNEAPNGACWEKDDPDQNPWVWERKFEVDSLCYPLQLAYLLWKNTG